MKVTYSAVRLRPASVESDAIDRRIGGETHEDRRFGGQNTEVGGFPGKLEKNGWLAGNTITNYQDIETFKFD